MAPPEPTLWQDPRLGAERVPVPPPRLVAIAGPERWRQPGFAAELAALAVDLVPLGAGQGAVLLRQHDQSPGRWLAALHPLEAALRGSSLRIGISAPPVASPAEAVACVLALAGQGIDFVQVPEAAPGRLLWPAAVRAARKDAFGIAWSCHDAPGVAAALEAGADWVVLSPAFATPSKPGVAGLGVQALADVAKSAPGRVVALGGIDPDNAGAVLAAGAAGVAAVRAAWDAGRRALVAAWGDNPPAQKASSAGAGSATPGGRRY